MTEHDGLSELLKLIDEMPPIPATMEEPKCRSFNFLAFHLRTRAYASSLLIKSLVTGFSQISPQMPAAATGILYARALAELESSRPAHVNAAIAAARLKRYCIDFMAYPSGWLRKN